MADVTICTTTHHDSVAVFIEKVYTTCKTDTNLSYRSKHEISAAYENGLIQIAKDGEVIVGWLMRIPYTNAFQELAAGYVEDSYRSKGVFGKLLESALRYTLSSCIVTFNRSFAHRLQDSFHFRSSSLGEAIWFSKGKFLTHRLSLSRLRAIKNHYKNSKPIYIIYRKI